MCLLGIVWDVRWIFTCHKFIYISGVDVVTLSCRWNALVAASRITWKMRGSKTEVLLLLARAILLSIVGLIPISINECSLCVDDVPVNLRGLIAAGPVTTCPVSAASGTSQTGAMHQALSAMCVEPGECVMTGRLQPLGVSRSVAMPSTNAAERCSGKGRWLGSHGRDLRSCGRTSWFMGPWPVRVRSPASGLKPPSSWRPWWKWGCGGMWCCRTMWWMLARKAWRDQVFVFVCLLTPE